MWNFQGGEGDCFYVVGDGEFEVLATQVILFVLCATKRIMFIIS